MKESNIQREIMLACSKAGDLCWRNNVGIAWQGRQVVTRGRDRLLIDARPVRFGLAKGASDLIGIRPTVITKDMVGQTVGVFLALEVKTPTGRITAPQALFGDAVSRAGGVFGVVRSVDDLEAVT